MAKPTVLIEEFADMLGFGTTAPQAEPTALLAQSGLTEMEFAFMYSFPNHKFKLYEGQRLSNIHYNFVGEIPLPCEIAKKETA